MTMKSIRQIRSITDDLRDLAKGAPINDPGLLAEASSLISELSGRHPEMHKYTMTLERLFTEHFSGKRIKNPITCEVYEVTARINMLEYGIKR